MRKITLLVIILIILAGNAIVPQTRRGSQGQAYVDSSLQSEAAGLVSVIVTAATSSQAVQAVRELGGVIRSELWLIDAVSASLPRQQIDRLAHTPGIRSIVNNHTITTAVAPDCSSDPNTYEPCSGNPGWVTDRQEKKAELQLAAKQSAPIVSLPDGSLVAVSESNLVSFLNADGSLRSQLSLFYKNARSSPVVGTDGAVFFTGIDPLDSTKTIVFALNPNGSLRWSYANKELVPGGIAVSPDGTFVYIGSIKVKMYVLDAASGVKLWEVRPPLANAGLMDTPPLVAPDGTIYLMSSGIQPEKIGLTPNLLAIDPSKFPIDPKLSNFWRYVGEVDGSLDYKPVLSGNGLIYLFSQRYQKVYAVNTATGALQFTFSTAKRSKLSLSWILWGECIYRLKIICTV